MEINQSLHQFGLLEQHLQRSRPKIRGVCKILPQHPHCKITKLKCLLLGAAMIEPYCVPLFLDKGQSKITSINDLNIRMFIWERDCALTVIREHDDMLDNEIPSYNIRPFYIAKKQYAPLSPPWGNLLVIMHDLTTPFFPHDISAEEFNIITNRIIRADQQGDLFKGKMQKRGGW
ncbi:hypothetical protein BD769DRAFT_1388228 [Suillus cothurnatus]|nr:hypothetical protein BD769DRAFT_1388228 [Suillus cothurnatus]